MERPQISKIYKIVYSIYQLKLHPRYSFKNEPYKLRIKPILFVGLSYVFGFFIGSPPFLTGISKKVCVSKAVRLSSQPG
jgi:hypothetical protein